MKQSSGYTCCGYLDYISKGERLNSAGWCTLNMSGMISVDWGPGLNKTGDSNLSTSIHLLLPLACMCAVASSKFFCHGFQAMIELQAK